MRICENPVGHVMVGLPSTYRPMSRISPDTVPEGFVSVRLSTLDSPAVLVARSAGAAIGYAGYAVE
jgi:hypothetical protein